MNTCTGRQDLPIRIHKQDIPIPREGDNASRNFGLHEDEESILEEQDIEGDHRNFVGKRLDTRSRVSNSLSGRTLQAGLLGSELSSSLKEVRFSDQEFAAGTPVSNIKYNYPRFQNDNPCYPFHDQLDYRLAKYFAESETTKSNVDKFLSEPLMAPLTEKLSYRNADKWIEKLLEISWGIPNDKQFEYKFEHQSGVARMARQEIAIHLRNVVDCLEILMGHPGFRHNQTYEPSRIYNENEQRVSNKMHTGEWWWKQQKEHSPQATIIPILISSDKTVMSLSHKDQILWPVYITIENLDAKTRRSQKRLGTLFFCSIPIIYERSKDANNKNKDLKAKIYYMSLKTMLQCTYLVLSSKEMRR